MVVCLLVLLVVLNLMVIKITLNDFIGKVIRFNHTNIEGFDSNIKLVMEGTSRKNDYDKCRRVKKIMNNL